MQDPATTDDDSEEPDETHSIQEHEDEQEEKLEEEQEKDQEEALEQVQDDKQILQVEEKAEELQQEPTVAHEDGEVKQSEGRDKKVLENKESMPFLLVSPEIPLAPLCHRCKTPVDAMRSQVSGKAKGCWRCSSCNTKGT